MLVVEFCLAGRDLVVLVPINFMKIEESCLVFSLFSFVSKEHAHFVFNPRMWR